LVFTAIVAAVGGVVAKRCMSLRPVMKQLTLGRTGELAVGQFLEELREDGYAEAWATCNKCVTEHPGVPEPEVVREWMAELRMWDVKRLRALGPNYELNKRNDVARKLYEEALSRYDSKEEVPDLQERLEAIKAADVPGTR
jgi:hypothetical protein